MAEPSQPDAGHLRAAPQLLPLQWETLLRLKTQPPASTGCSPRPLCAAVSSPKRTPQQEPCSAGEPAEDDLDRQILTKCVLTVAGRAPFAGNTRSVCLPRLAGIGATGWEQPPTGEEVAREGRCTSGFSLTAQCLFLGACEHEVKQCGNPSTRSSVRPRTTLLSLGLSVHSHSSPALGLRLVPLHRGGSSSEARGTEWDLGGPCAPRKGVWFQSHGAEGPGQ